MASKEERIAPRQTQLGRERKDLQELDAEENARQRALGESEDESQRRFREGLPQLQQVPGNLGSMNYDQPQNAVASGNPNPGEGTPPAPGIAAATNPAAASPGKRRRTPGNAKKPNVRKTSPRSTGSGDIKITSSPKFDNRPEIHIHNYAHPAPGNQVVNPGQTQQQQAPAQARQQQAPGTTAPTNPATTAPGNTVATGPAVAAPVARRAPTIPGLGVTTPPPAPRGPTVPGVGTPGTPNPAPGTPPAVPARNINTAPPTAQEIADRVRDHNVARDAYFAHKNTKRPTDNLAAIAYDRELAIREATYQANKKKVVEVHKRNANPDIGNIESRMFLRTEIVLNKENEAKNAKGFEKVKNVIAKSIKWYENLGQDPNDSKWTRFGKRTAKFAIGAAMIGGASATVVAGLAAAGIGTATAISGGILSVAGQRALTSAVVGNALSGLPPSMHAVAMPAMLAFSAAPIAIAGGVGMGASWLAKKASGKWLSEEVILKKRQEAERKPIDWTNMDQAIKNIEADYAKIEKEASSTRMKRRLLLGTVALAAGVGTLEAIGVNYDNDATRHATPSASGPTAGTPEAGVTSTSATPEEVSGPNTVNHEGVTFENGKGAIEGIRDLKEQLKQEYSNDFSNAPQSIKDFIAETNEAKQAINFGFFNPDDPSGKESALIHAGSTLKFDADGNLVFHDEQTGEETRLMAQSPDDTVGGGQRFSGKMLDTDHSARVASIPSSVEATNVWNNGEDLVNRPESISQEAWDRMTETERLMVGDYKDPNAFSGGEGSPETNEPPRYVPDNLHRTENELRETLMRQLGQKSPNEGHESVMETEADRDQALLDPRFRVTNPLFDTNRIAGNEFKLGSEDLQVANKIYMHNIHEVFPQPEQFIPWREEHASDLLKKDALEAANSNPSLPSSQITHWLHKLKEASGLEPGGFLIFGREDIQHYAARATQLAVEKGNIDQVIFHRYQ